MMQKKYFSVMRQRLYFLIAIGILLVASAIGTEANDNDRPQIVSGQIVEIDPAGSEVTINYRDSSGTSLVYMTLIVTDDTVLTGGKDTIGLEGMQIGDRLEIEFTGDPMNHPTAKRINDLDRTNW